MVDEKKPRKKRLKTLSDIRRYLSCLINETRHGEVEPSLAGRIAFMLNILKNVITDGDLERRITELEEAMNKK